MSGYIKLHRTQFDHPMFVGEPLCKLAAWNWLIARAAFRETRVRSGSEIVTLKRGQLTCSVRYMAEAWGWSKSSVDRFIRRLEAESMASLTRSKSGTGFNLITICNYDLYQGDGENLGQQWDSSGTAAGQQRDKEEESKNLRREESKDSFSQGPRVVCIEGAASRKKRPIGEDETLSERQAMDAEARGLTPEQAERHFADFRDHARANDRQYADWDAAWRRWITSPNFAAACEEAAGGSSYDLPPFDAEAFCKERNLL